MDDKALNRNWYYFLSLDRDLHETTFYIEPEGQEKTFSFAFYKLIMLGGAEAESLLKQLCNEIAPGNTFGDIGQYKNAILNKYPKIEDAIVSVSRWGGKDIRPFENWGTGRLKWWAVYNDIKHSRFKTIESATYENAAYTLGALFILNYYLFELSSVMLPTDSKSFECRYAPRILVCSADEKLPDF